MFHKAAAVVSTIPAGMQVQVKWFPQQVNLNLFADDHMLHKGFKPDI